MIINVILIIFAYLLIGVAVLEGILWRDRKKNFIEKWIDETDDVGTSLIVMFWPATIPVLGGYILFIGLKHLIKGVRIFFTTIVYLIAAMIDKDREDKG